MLPSSPSPVWPLLSRDAEGFPLGRPAGRCSCTGRLFFSCPGGSLLLPAPAAKQGQNLRSSSLTEQRKLIVVMTFFRKELSCLHLPQANQLSVLSSFLFSPVPLSLVHSLRNRGDSLLWDFFPPFAFFLHRNLSAGGGGQGPASSVPSFHLPLCQA